MFTKQYKFFNQSTRLALFEGVKGYVDKSESILEEIEKLKTTYNLKQIYRYDLGENVDGFSPKVATYLNNLMNSNELFSLLNQYPDITHKALRIQLSNIYQIPRECFVISTGLDSILDLITRVFFEPKDIYLMPLPGFYLFEQYSERMGAVPVFLNLKEEDQFAWTNESAKEFKELIIKFRPKLIWISNPSNPTGQIIPEPLLKEILSIAHSYNVFVVIDEAYGEYVGLSESSASSYIMQYPNIMVLRTFSKAYGLAGLRLGYLMSSSSDIIKGLLTHRHHFPVSQLTLDIAKIALGDNEFIYETIKHCRRRRMLLFSDLYTLRTFEYIPSYTSIFMLKNKYLSGQKLHKILKMNGILTSIIPQTGLANKNFIRVTVRNEIDNEYFYSICKQIDDRIWAIKEELVRLDNNSKIPEFDLSSIIIQ
ncbi:MAG: histidinol-phosphate aminotransferase family protein [Bacteroidales bacterium]|nr:histidinol-phosphate aminotransferase family protein [Bacteroidales bacterium]